LVKKGFPSFGITQCGSYVAALKNYNLPDFVLTLVAKDCNSDLLVRGRIDDRLASLNDAALELLHRVFVDCEEDEAGEYAQYRFFAYVSSMYHKSEVVINETIPGKSGKNHKVPIAVKQNGMYIAIGFNKAIGNAVSKRDIKNFDVTAEYRLNQYLKFVRPAYFKYIMPTKQYADIVIKNNYDSHLDEFVGDFLLNMKL